MDLLARFKLLVVSFALLGGCFLQGTVTIFLLSAVAGLLGGTTSPAFQVFSVIWMIAMFALLGWFIWWLVTRLGRRVDQAAERTVGRLVDSVGLGSAAHPAPPTGGERAPDLAELDARLAPADETPTTVVPGHDQP